jgi:hypothetical protein
MSEQNTEFENAMQKKFGWNNTEHILQNPDEYSETVYLCVYYAWEGWQASTVEANKRIEALELEVQNWKDFCKKVQKIDFNDYLALQADNKRLREALVNCLDMIGHEDNIEYINKVLSATPAESLQAHDNEVISKIAMIVNDETGNADLVARIEGLKGK